MYNNENKGALFRVKKKKTEKSPDYSGKLNINGSDYSLSGWVRESQKGEKFFALAVKPAEPVKEEHESEDVQPIGDDIPF
jgi:hypothetical protein